MRAWSPERSTSGTGVGRRVEARLSERFRLERSGIEGSGALPDGGVEEGQCGNLATREHEVAERVLPGTVQLDDAIVDPLVVSADEDQAIEPSEFDRVGVRERFARGRGHDDFAPLARRSRRENPVENPSDGLEAEHHSGPAAVGAVVGPFAAVQSVQNVVQFNASDAPLLSPAEDREPNRRCEHLREERDDVNVKEGVQCNVPSTSEAGSPGRAGR